MKCPKCKGKGYILNSDKPGDDSMCDTCGGSSDLKVAFEFGIKVKKVGGDYTYEGVIAGIILKTSGEIRYVVEDDRGMLFIFNEKSLELLPK